MHLSLDPGGRREQLFCFTSEKRPVVGSKRLARRGKGGGKRVAGLKKRRSTTLRKKDLAPETQEEGAMPISSQGGKRSSAFMFPPRTEKDKKRREWC